MKTLFTLLTAVAFAFSGCATTGSFNPAPVSDLFAGLALGQVKDPVKQKAMAGQFRTVAAVLKSFAGQPLTVAEFRAEIVSAVGSTPDKAQTVTIVVALYSSAYPTLSKEPNKYSDTLAAIAESLIMASNFYLPPPPVNLPLPPA